MYDMEVGVIKVLCIGDICGSIGCQTVYKHLMHLKKRHNIDLTIANAENSAEKNGITKDSAQFLFNIGVDVITGGNHSFRNEESFNYIDEQPFLLRPHNLHTANIGTGYCLVDKGRYSVAGINLSGKIYLERLESDNPFLAADELIERAKSDGANIIIVDFHAEATSEKRAMGFYLDGKVSAMFGTHTHVATADEQILPNGTGYITDIGMTGTINSVLGVKSDIIISRFRDNNMQKFELATGEAALNGIVIEIDEKTGKTIDIKRIREG